MVVLLVSICIVESFLVAWLLHSQWLLPIEYIKGVVGVNETQLLYILNFLKIFLANSNDERKNVLHFHLHLYKKSSLSGTSFKRPLFIGPTHLVSLDI